MQWEQLTSTDLAKAATETGGICLIAMGVIERHSEHLPLGTDFLNGHKIACLAAEKDMKRLEHIPNLFSGIKWYSRYPRHYAGDARKASKEKGEFLVDLMTESLAEFISAVKNDQVTEDLRKEFFSKCRHEK